MAIRNGSRFDLFAAAPGMPAPLGQLLSARPSNCPQT